MTNKHPTITLTSNNENMKNILLTFAALVLSVIPLMAQDLILPKQGNPITAYNIDAGGSFIYYTTEQDANAVLSRIAKDSVLMIRKADGSVMDFSATQPAKATLSSPAASQNSKQDYPVINEADIHGSLIAKGNKVFIPTNSHNEFERAGQERLKEKVQEWDYWVMVDAPEQAHFVLQYVLTSVGQDWAHLLIRPRKYYSSRPFIDDLSCMRAEITDAGARVCRRRSDDTDIQANITNADIFFTHLKGMLSDAEYNKKVSKDYKMAINYFNKVVIKYLDADKESNTVYCRGDYGGGLL